MFLNFSVTFINLNSGWLYNTSVKLVLYIGYTRKYIGKQLQREKWKCSLQPGVMFETRAVELLLLPKMWDKMLPSNIGVSRMKNDFNTKQ